MLLFDCFSMSASAGGTKRPASAEAGSSPGTSAPPAKKVLTQFTAFKIGPVYSLVSGKCLERFFLISNSHNQLTQ